MIKDYVREIFRDYMFLCYIAVSYVSMVFVLIHVNMKYAQILAKLAPGVGICLVTGVVVSFTKTFITYLLKKRRNKK